jgi:hypothetical protein
MNFKTVLSQFFFPLFFIPFVALIQITATTDIRQCIDLSGQWQFRIDYKNRGIVANWYKKSFDDFTHDELMKILY